MRQSLTKTYDVDRRDDILMTYNDFRETFLKYFCVQAGISEAQQRLIYRFSIEYMYEEFQKSGWDRVWSIVGENIKFRRRCSIEELFGEGVSYESAKSKLLIRPLNYTVNRYDLRKSIYRQIGDIALVLYAVGYHDNDMLSTIKVPIDYPEKWGTDPETAFDEALLNTAALRPPRLYFTSRECVAPPYERGAFMAFGAEFHIAGSSVSPTLTTYPNTNGAIAFFYPRVQEKLAEVMGDSYYIAFTSIHEARLHLKGSKSPREILFKLKSVNQTFKRGEILSRKVYFYDEEKRSLEQLDL